MTRSIRVLVVEDDPMIALDIESELAERGFEVVGPIGRARAAMELVAEEAPAAAVLDINLGAENSFEIAALLDEKRVPFIFLSGDTMKRPEEFKDRPLVAKPVNYSELERVLTAALS